MPAVDVTFEPAELGYHGDRRSIEDPAPGDDGIAALLGPDRHLLARAAADRRQMYEADVARIDQVVADAQVARSYVKRISVRRCPARVVVLGQVEQLGLVGARRVAGPNPHQAQVFDDREGSDSRIRRDHLLAGYPNASSAAVESHSVIAALHRIVHEAAHRKRQQPVGAAILQRHDFIAAGAIERDMLLDYRAPGQRMADLA